MLTWYRHDHARPHCSILTEACSCRLELAYFAGKLSKNRLVCKNAVALAYYGSCRLVEMSSWSSLINLNRWIKKNNTLKINWLYSKLFFRYGSSKTKVVIAFKRFLFNSPFNSTCIVSFNWWNIRVLRGRAPFGQHQKSDLWEGPIFGACAE